MDKSKWKAIKKQLKMLEIDSDRFSAVSGIDKFPFRKKIIKKKILLKNGIL